MGVYLAHARTLTINYINENAHFSLEAPQFTPAKGKELPGTVTVEVCSGNLDGDEIVQLCIHDKVSKEVRPVKELNAFQKISLSPQ